jgi:hypothetical protein
MIATGRRPPGSRQRMVRLLLKCKTTRTRAEKIRSVINVVYPARLTGERGKYEVRFKVAENDTKHVWLLLMIKDAKDIKRVKQPND